MDGVSVVICCYNSAARIGETLLHISRQKVSTCLKWEVILINNNSTDDTRLMAQKAWETHLLDIPFSIVDEDTPGLKAARARGVECSRYEVIVFCDDDNWLDENYIQTAYEIISSNKEIGVLGGVIISACEVLPPKWFEQFKYAYAVGEQGNEEGDISERFYIWGAGMIIRKSLLLKIQSLEYKTFLTDRKGQSLTAGEDSEISMLAIIIGYKLWFSPRLRLKHFIPVNRLRWKYIVGLVKGFGASEISLSPTKKILMLNGREPQAPEVFSWKKESLKILLTWASHPKRTLLGLIGREGESAVLWFYYSLSYLTQLIRFRNKVDSMFMINVNKLKSHRSLK